MNNILIAKWTKSKVTPKGELAKAFKAKPWTKHTFASIDGVYAELQESGMPVEKPITSIVIIGDKYYGSNYKNLNTAKIRTSAKIIKHLKRNAQI